MRSPLPVALVAGILFAPAACQQAPDISGELDLYGGHLSSVYTESCNCPEELGYESLTECSEALGFVGEDELQCLEDASAGYESEVQAYLDCANPVLDDYVDCLDANSSCVEGAYGLCVTGYQDGVGACPALPEAMRAEFESCTA